MQGTMKDLTKILKHLRLNPNQKQHNFNLHHGFEASKLPCSTLMLLEFPWVVLHVPIVWFGSFHFNFLHSYMFSIFVSSLCCMLNLHQKPPKKFVEIRFCSNLVIFLMVVFFI